mgnify:FL=1
MEVSTSLLSVKKEDIIQTIYNLEVAHTDYFHIDVMDGRFVENDTSETMRIYCEYLNQVTNVPIDVHLMVTNIKEYIDSYSIFNPNIITFHYEACKNKEEVYKYIGQIKGRECKVGLAIKPNTNIDEIVEFLPKINLLLIMSVEPGKGGQKFIESTTQKIKKAKTKIDELNLETEIEVDGGVNLENSKEIKEAGATMLVSGTGIINSKDYNYTIRKMKE